MKGNNGKTIIEMWDELFQANEQRVADGKKPWSDDELIAKMEENFPKSKGKSTLNRPRMFRSHYNNGTFTFARLGSAKSRGVPESFKYGESGQQVLPGKRLSQAAKDATSEADGDNAPLSKLMKKGKAAKKGKVAKKAGKKKVVRRRK